MNTNSTPVEYPIWVDGVIYYPVTPAQDQKASDSEASLSNPSSQLATLSQPPGEESATLTPDTNHLNPPELESNTRVSTSHASIPLLKTPPERHTRKCIVCNHEDREAIEQAYLNWISPELISRQFDLRSYASVYRHVEAVGLPALRRRSKLAALDLIIEQAGQIRATGSDVIRAIITSSRIGEDGDYIEPVRRTQINHTISSEKPISNRKPKLLETP